ncbi:MAG: hypothetical protein A2937_00415 [Candidatus Yonathbacteria bacterium RIFCSPLOWO2_01_FULL_47_33b]|uniref:SpoVT-AbrB domain-containing protein n=1 Tax=Candidatus Yonathbacteria bacterium RIFCSPLOWO2_01_FULL_47_33b TaxID=1802727 RepID=A0A1G2SG13_9BACT|nr:MAG: hypothetical protein A2937_00415 [Candidatus Yonathbacteria bacterium RIFCSPLOWO2_01_FULL_47_33b]
MTTKYQKWGNSLAIRIPKEIAREVNIREGSDASFSVENGVIMLSSPKKPKYTLEGLLKNFDKKTQHELIDWGPDVGNEVLPPWQN